MADPINRRKIRELQAYTVLDPSDPNYIDPNEILVAIDSNNVKWGSALPKVIP